MTTVVMKRTAARARRDAIINLRVPANLRDLFDAAAEATGKTRTQFVVDSARTQAIDVLLEKKIFKLGDAAFAAFLSALDKPPAANEKLKALFSRKAQWEA